MVVLDREFGSKTGSGGVASAQQEAIDRRERLRRLALETIDLAKDPYLMRNHLGQYECKLCLTLHTNEGNYLAHTQGKRHQTNLAKRAAMEAREKPQKVQPTKAVQPRRTVKIGRPGYRVTKQFDPDTEQRSLLFEIDYPDIEQGERPRHRVMSAFEQKVEACDKRYQYLLVAAEPYETIAFKIPNVEVDKSEGRFFTDWDPDSKAFVLQIHFRANAQMSMSSNIAPPTKGLPPPPPNAGMNMPMSLPPPPAMPPPPDHDMPMMMPPPPPPM